MGFSAWTRNLFLTEENVERLIDIGERFGFFGGNVTIAGQTVVGAISLFDGGCSAADGCLTEVNPISKCLLITGGCLELVGGTCLVANSVLVSCAPPAVLVTSAVGFASRRVGKHVISLADKTSLIT